MIRVAIVEDDPNSAELLREYARQFFREKQEECAFSLFSNGQAIVENYQPVFDLIFLDIEMKPLDGMQAAQQIRQTDKQTVIIFVTQMAQYAVKGYEVGALDFMVKPVDYYSFAFKMTRVLQYLDVHREVKVVVREEGNFQVLPSREIYYIEVMNHDLIYHTKTGVYQERGSLNELEKKLQPTGFKRCNKSYLINMAHIAAIQGSSISIGGDTIPLSRSMRKTVICALADYYGGKV